MYSAFLLLTDWQCIDISFFCNWSIYIRGAKPEHDGCRLGFILVYGDGVRTAMMEIKVMYFVCCCVHTVCLYICVDILTVVVVYCLLCVWVYKHSLTQESSFHSSKDKKITTRQ